VDLFISFWGVLGRDLVYIVIAMYKDSNLNRVKLIISRLEVDTVLLVTMLPTWRRCCLAFHSEI
jgi:hypothetical protein